MGQAGSTGKMAETLLPRAPSSVSVRTFTGHMMRMYCSAVRSPCVSR